MRQPYGDRASFRTRTPTYGTTSAYVTFKLRNGKSVRLGCAMR